MLPRAVKAAFYVAAGPLMQVNGWIYRLCRAPSNADAGLVRVHLGPGQKAYLPGWINIDANMFTGQCDVWADLRNPLPFHSATVDAVYSHHVIEHLPNIEAHFREVYRILKPGGVYRIGGPNGDAAARKLIDGDRKWFYDWPDRYDSVGGGFVNFIFCRNEHLTMLTESFVRELGQRAGFGKAEKLLPVTETRSPLLFSDCLATEHEQDFDTPHTLVMELVK